MEPGAWIVRATNDIAKTTGLREGDRIIAVNGRSVSDFAMPRKDCEVTCTVERGSERFDVRVPIETLVP